MDDIETFDRLVHQAWPAPEQVTAGSWIYRYAAGVTKRANSVLPLTGPGSWDRVDEAERFYRDLGRPCVFSIGPGAEKGLDAELEARGYGLVDPTLIMTAETAPSPGAQVAETPTADWLDMAPTPSAGACSRATGWGSTAWRYGRPRAGRATERPCCVRCWDGGTRTGPGAPIWSSPRPTPRLVPCTNRPDSSSQAATTTA
jgi:hypothetical protein